MRKLTILFILFTAGTAAFSQVNKQETRINPSPMLWNKRLYDEGTMKGLLSAGRMPEEFYSYKPTDSLSSFGQVLGDVADWQYQNCSVLLGEKNLKSKIDAPKASKADLIAALKDSLAICTAGTKVSLAFPLT